MERVILCMHSPALRSERGFLRMGLQCLRSVVHKAERVASVHLLSGPWRLLLCLHAVVQVSGTTVRVAQVFCAQLTVHSTEGAVIRMHSTDPKGLDGVLRRQRMVHGSTCMLPVVSKSLRRVHTENALIEIGEEGVLCVNTIIQRASVEMEHRVPVPAPASAIQVEIGGGVTVAQSRDSPRRISL